MEGETEQHNEVNTGPPASNLRRGGIRAMSCDNLNMAVLSNKTSASMGESRSYVKKLTKTRSKEGKTPKKVNTPSVKGWLHPSRPHETSTDDDKYNTIESEEDTN